MGFSFPRRPVVLLVEDELLLRMDATAMVAEAGFEVVEAGDADEAIAILESRRDIRHCFYRHPDAGFDGRAEARPRDPRPLATDQDRRDIRPCGCRGKRFARGWTVFAETIPRETSCQGSAAVPRIVLYPDVIAGRAKFDS